MGIATYNWSMRPGKNNKWGIQVSDGPDELPPSGHESYVALWGNDITGNGSRKYPYRTISRAVKHNAYSNAYIYIGSGVYREAEFKEQSVVWLVADGNCIIDGTLLGVDSLTNNDLRLRGVEVRGVKIPVINGRGTDFRKAKINGATRLSMLEEVGIMTDSIISFSNVLSTSTSVNLVHNNTYYRCNVVFSDITVNSNVNNIYVDCNIYFRSAPIGVDFSIFDNCNFQFLPGPYTDNPVFPTELYPLVPDGYVKLGTIADLRATSSAVFGAGAYNFNNCEVTDPKFNNSIIGDFTLAFDSPAKNRSYFGTYIGACSVATGLKARSNAAISDFDNSSAVNLTIADDSITFITKGIVGTIETKPINNIQGRELSNLPVYGLNADRNGEYVDATTDLSTNVITAGNTIEISTPYLVEVGSIIYNTQVYQPGDRFTSDATGGTFTTGTGGQVREIIEAPTRQNVEARFSDGALQTISSTGTLTADSWYMVEQADIVYNAINIGVGQFFKTKPTALTFTGSGVVREIFTPTYPFNYFEIDHKPLSNNQNDSRTGDIIRGNGDKNFDRDHAFPISKKFIQLRYTLQAHNLKP